MQPVFSEKKCLSCGSRVVGRTDKKFCNDYCRNHFNNLARATNHASIRQVNNILLRNRRILESILGMEKMLRVNRDLLLQRGFNFQYLTHTLSNRKGNIYYFNYDHGYLKLDDENYLIVRSRVNDN